MTKTYKDILNPLSTVVINATNIGWKMNGIGNYSLNIIKQLIALDPRSDFIIYLNKSCKVHFRDTQFPENMKIRWVSSAVSPDKKFWGHLLRLLYSNYLSIKHFWSFQFNTSPLEVCFFKRNQLLTVHDVIPLLFKKYHKKQFLFYKVIMKYVLKKVKMVLAPSFYTKELILKHSGLPEEKVTVIQLAVDKRNYQYEQYKFPASPYILYVGRINGMKNVSGILKSFKILRKSIPIDLVLVGDDKKEFIKLLDKCRCDEEIKSKIMFLNDVSEFAKFKLMENASLFLYPTLSEGFGFPPLEAMQTGCPVIVSNTSSFPEVCGNAAYYVDPNNEKEIADGILKVLTNNQLRNELIKNGWKRILQFSWKKTVSEHLRVIEQITYRPHLFSSFNYADRKRLLLEGKERMELN